MEEETQAQTEGRALPMYRSHKVVHALRIAEIHPHDAIYPPGAEIVPAEEGYAPFDVDGNYMAKHEPVVGGYYVVYEDGYKSFSPAEAFEEGYSLIE